MRDDKIEKYKSNYIRFTYFQTIHIYKFDWEIVTCKLGEGRYVVARWNSYAEDGTRPSVPRSKKSGRRSRRKSVERIGRERGHDGHLMHSEHHHGHPANASGEAVEMEHFRRWKS